jgi:ADP-ribose pyrophosphatase
MQTVFEGRLFRVERRVRELDGRRIVRDIVMHPGAAIILPIHADGRVVLIRNYREAVGQELLEVPAGTLDPDETPAACAARELTEETGYTAGRLTPLLTFYSTPGILNERMHAFVATDLTAGAPALEAGEQIRPAEMAFDEALDAIRAGRIVDAKTIVALLHYDRFVRSTGGAA